MSARFVGVVKDGPGYVECRCGEWFRGTGAEMKAWSEHHRAAHDESEVRG